LYAKEKEKRKIERRKRRPLPALLISSPRIDLDDTLAVTIASSRSNERASARRDDDTSGYVTRGNT
jgi:hypothetical protein